MKILFIADIFGSPGRAAVKELLPELISEYKIDFTIANAENAAGGFGITEKIANELFGYGINAITLGNHTWDKKEVINLIKTEQRITRPANYPKKVPGNEFNIYEKDNIKIAVISLLGRVFMDPLDCPFQRVDEIINQIQNTVNIIIVDIHAEATAEKIAIGYFLDGKVTAVIGTHTHVSTTDLKLLPNGTAYITDAGMTGPVDSIIGVKKEIIIEKFLTGLPVKFEVHKGLAQLEGVFLDIDANGKPVNIIRIQKFINSENI